MYKCENHVNNIISNIFFCSSGHKDDEQNLIAESNSNDTEKTITQSPMVTQRYEVDAQREVFISLTLP